MEPLAGNPEPGAASHREGLAREGEALRIQAAAVAAQQAALTEEELRLEHRRQTLDRQEAQLAAHLEAKRQRSLHIRNRLRSRARALETARQDLDAQTRAAAVDLERLRDEVKETEEAASAERQRLLELRQRFVRHWRRRWAGQEAELERRAGQLAEERHTLEQQAAALRRAQADLAQVQMRVNGEHELARRQLQAQREELRQQTHQQNRLETEIQSRVRALDERERALCARQQQLIAEEAQRRQTLGNLRAEIDGLENRIRQQRARLPGPSASAGESAHRSLPAAAGPAAAWSGDERTRLDVLELLSGDLADQRVQLIEQQERLAASQSAFQTQRVEAVADLEALALRFQEREQIVLGVEQHLAETEIRLRQRSEESAAVRRHLEGWQGRLAAHEVAWEGERESLLARCAASEQLLQRDRQTLGELRRRWIAVRRRELERLRADHAHSEQLRRECAAAREEWLRRAQGLDQEQRRLAERGLALEQYRLETISQAPDSAAAEKKLRKLERRWQGLHAAAARRLAVERQTLESAFSRLDERSREIEEASNALVRREAEGAQRQSAWEHDRAALEGANAILRKEMQTLQTLGEVHEEQVAALRDEVERMARLLMDDGEQHSPPLDRAA